MASGRRGHEPGGCHVRRNHRVPTRLSDRCFVCDFGHNVLGSPSVHPEKEGAGIQTDSSGDSGGRLGGFYGADLSLHAHAYLWRYKGTAFRCNVYRDVDYM